MRLLTAYHSSQINASCEYSLVLCSQLQVRTIHSSAFHNYIQLTTQRLCSRETTKHWKLQICFAGVYIFFLSLDFLYCCFACCLLAYLWGIFPRCNVNKQTLVRLPAISDDFLFRAQKERKWTDALFCSKIDYA